jgi:hypothetical protein
MLNFGKIITTLSVSDLTGSKSQLKRKLYRCKDDYREMKQAQIELISKHSADKKKLKVSIEKLSSVSVLLNLLGGSSSLPFSAEKIETLKKSLSMLKTELQAQTGELQAKTASTAKLQKERQERISDQKLKILNIINHLNKK